MTWELRYDFEQPPLWISLNSFISVEIEKEKLCSCQCVHLRLGLTICSLLQLPSIYCLPVFFIYNSILFITMP